MKKFVLKNSADQEIMRVRSKNIENAIKYFSKIKNLPTKDLLTVFQVIEVED